MLPIKTRGGVVEEREVEVEEEEEEEDGFAVLLGTAGGCSCGLNTFK